MLGKYFLKARPYYWHRRDGQWLSSLLKLAVGDDLLSTAPSPSEWFLEAQKGGEKSYALLHRALMDTAKIGIAKVAICSREYLAAVKPDGLFLMLELMHFAHEVVDPEGLKTPFGVELNPKEISMAKALIETLTSEWGTREIHRPLPGRAEGGH